jgi:polyribonucleotide nucleotidyltransferase
MTGGKEILVETGKLAKQADGSVVVRMGDTMLLATVVAAKEAKEGVDFLPLTVDYREKYAAAGRFLADSSVVRHALQKQKFS